MKIFGCLGLIMLALLGAPQARAGFSATAHDQPAPVRQPQLQLPQALPGEAPSPLLPALGPSVPAEPAYAPEPPPVIAPHDESAYRVDDVAVDVTAASAAAARDKAIFDGQRDALRQLLERMEAGQRIDPAKMTDNKIAALVKNFEITSEKASNVRYIATMNVRFKPGAMQSLLAQAGVTYVAAPAAPVVVLPVSDSDGRPVLWEERTVWRAALDELERARGLQPVVIPSGELSDVGAIDARAALQGDAVSLGAMASLYNAGAVIVAQVAGDVVKLSPSQPLTIILTRYDRSGMKLDTRTVTVPAAADTPAQMAAARQMVQGFIINRVLNTTPEQGLPAAASLQLYAPLSSLPELTKLRQRLGSISAIQRINVQSVRRDGADLVLDFNGDQVQLQQSMAAQGLMLMQSPTGQWQIRSN